MKRVVLLLIPLGVSLSAQQVRFETPTLGYVYDPEAKAIRQVGGVPGAASFEAAVEAGGSVERAWISRLGYALIQGKEESGSGRLVDWTNSQSRQLGLFDEAAVSNSGRYFALLRNGGVEVWDGVSGSLQWKLAQAPEGARSLAVSDDGVVIQIASATGLWLADEGGSARSIWSGDSLLGGGFLGATRDFAAVDASRGKVLTSRAGATVEADAPISGITAFSTAGVSQLVFGGSRSLAILDLDTGMVRTLESESAVEGFARALQGGDVLQVRFKDDNRAALLELAAGAAQIEFLAPAGGLR